MDEVRPAIPDFFHLYVKWLINGCWAQNSDERPSFVEILVRLDRMDFRSTDHVKSAKVRRFVDAVKVHEKLLEIKIGDCD